MKIQAILQQIWSIPELRNRTIYTLYLTLFYIALTYVLMPGIVAYEGVYDLSYVSIVPLGLMPYITATVLVIIPFIGIQLGMAPAFSQLIGGASVIFLVNFIFGTLHTVDTHRRLNGLEGVLPVSDTAIIGKEKFIKKPGKKASRSKKREQE